MKIQIDLLPHKSGDFRMNITADGHVYPSVIDRYSVANMVHRGLVHQVKKTVLDPVSGRVIKSNYPEGKDSTGVQYTSGLMEVKNY